MFHKTFITFSQKRNHAGMSRYEKLKNADEILEEAKQQQRKNILEKTNLILVITTGVLTLLLTTFAVVEYFGFFKKEKIVIHSSPFLFINQNFGNVTLYQDFIFENVGDKKGNVTKIEAFIRLKNAKEYLKMTVKKYSDGRTFQGIRLLSDDIFQTPLQLFQELDTNSTDYLDYLKNDIIDSYDSLHQKYANTNLSGLKIPDHLAKRVTEFTENRLASFKAGDYDYMVCFTKGLETTPFETKKYNLTIRPTDIIRLKNLVKVYLAFPQRDGMTRPEIVLSIEEIK